MASWNEPFLNIVERLLWKSIGLASAILPLIILACNVIEHKSRSRSFFERYARVAISLFTPIYCIVRVILIVLIFLSFRSLPSGVYDTPNWLEFLPFFH